jgi:hypothetical protein
VTAGRGVALAALLLGACRCGDTPAVRDAAPADARTIVDAAPPPSWPELAELPIAEPALTVAVPARPDVPRFDVHGPALTGDVAVVAASPLGFAAVALPAGRVIWTRPAGARVAPPLVVGGAGILVGDCPDDVASPDGDLLLGCLLQVDAARGADLGAAIIRGARADVEAFATATGPSRLRAVPGTAAIRWQRGERAVEVALATGAATPAAPIADRVELVYRGETWRWSVDDEALVARAGASAAGSPPSPARSAPSRPRCRWCARWSPAPATAAAPSPSSTSTARRGASARRPTPCPGSRSSPAPSGRAASRCWRCASTPRSRATTSPPSTATASSCGCGRCPSRRARMRSAWRSTGAASWCFTTAIV